MIDNDISVERKHGNLTDWVVLLVFAVLWLAFCAVFGTDEEALADRVQAHKYLLLQLASAATKGSPRFTMDFTCAVFIASVAALAWFLSKRPAIAVAASVVSAVGWVVFVNVNVWCMYLEDPEPDALGSGTPVALLCAAQHIAMAYVLLLCARWVRRAIEDAIPGLAR